MKHDGPERERQRLEVQLEEAALLLLVIDDVERVEDRLHAGIRAPQRQREADDEAEAERAVALGGDALDLLADDVHRPARQHAREGIEMVLDRRGIGEQAVDRDEGRDRREDREQSIEGHARRHGHDPVLPELLVDSP